MKTYLVTGGAGFIGSNFIIYMFKKYGQNIRIINMDSLTYAGNIQNLKSVAHYPSYSFIKGDICNKDTVIKIFNENEIDYVVNFAAESHVDRSINEPEIFIKTNILGTQILLEAAHNNWSENGGYRQGVKFIQISTDEVYGSLGKEGSFTEKTNLDPHSPYSASKASADLIVKAYKDTFKMPINITRCSNNYGPYQFPEKLIPLMINNALDGKKLPVYGDGKNVRDWIYVTDHCEAIDIVINKGVKGEVYNIGGNNEKENIEIINTILDMLIHLIKDPVKKCIINKGLITYVEDRKGHDKRYAIDATKIRTELGWTPKTSFTSGIEKTIKWYIENKNWLKNVRLQK